MLLQGCSCKFAAYIQNTSFTEHTRTGTYAQTCRHTLVYLQAKDFIKVVDYQ